MTYGVVCFATMFSFVGTVLGEALRVPVVTREHLAAARLDRGEIFLEQREIFAVAAPRERRKHMMNGEQQAALGDVGEQSPQVIAPALNLRVLPIRNVVNADVRDAAAGHHAGDFLADEKIGPMPQAFRGSDGVMIGHGDQIHSTTLQDLVDRVGVVIALAANPAKNRECAHAGVPRMNVQVAPHVPL